MQRMLEITRLIFGPFETNCYVVKDKQGNVLLIDPACSNRYEQEQLLKAVNPHSSIRVIATHGHLDHLWGAAWACAQWGMPVQVPEADIPMAKAMQQQYDLFGIRSQALPFNIQALSETSLADFNLQILPTPGHTPGSVCLYSPEDKVLFSGDTLFQMGFGRTDLPGGNWGELMNSLERLFCLPADVVVFPGHGERTTIGAERR